MPVNVINNWRARERASNLRVFTTLPQTTRYYKFHCIFEGGNNMNFSEADEQPLTFDIICLCVLFFLNKFHKRSVKPIGTLIVRIFTGAGCCSVSHTITFGTFLRFRIIPRPLANFLHNEEYYLYTVTLYGSETWTIGKRYCQQLAAFKTRYWRIILVL